MTKRKNMHDFPGQFAQEAFLAGVEEGMLRAAEALGARAPDVVRPLEERIVALENSVDCLERQGGRCIRCAGTGEVMGAEDFGVLMKPTPCPECRAKP